MDMRRAAAAYGTVMRLSRRIAAMNGYLVISGLVCLTACGFLLYKLMPQEGRPPSPWVSTDSRGTAAALGLLVLLLAGLSMMAKGLFG
jgi:hypothetical protein